MQISLVKFPFQMPPCDGVLDLECRSPLDLCNPRKIEQKSITRYCHGLIMCLPSRSLQPKRTSVNFALGVNQVIAPSLFIFADNVT